MLDKSVPFYNVLMKREKGKPLFEHSLPDQFRFVMFKTGDENDWAEIEASVGEFDNKELALQYFRGSYMLYQRSWKEDVSLLRITQVKRWERSLYGGHTRVKEETHGYIGLLSGRSIRGWDWAWRSYRGE